MSVIAVGGGKGGVGRTLIASGLAVFTAQLGKKVLLVDGHPFAQHLANSFGVVRTNGSVAPWAPTPSDIRGSETVVPNLRVLTANTELGAVPGITLRRPREITRASGADHCVLDLGMGVATPVIDAMLDVDVMVLVTTPEPSSVEAVYRFVRHAYARALARRLKGYPIELNTLRKIVRESGGPPAPSRLAEEVARVSEAGANIAWDALHRLKARLVVNCSRSRTDLDLGESMSVVAYQQLGIHLEYLGHVEFDEAVVLVARRRRPLLVDVPGAKASRNLERIARRLLSLEAGRGERPATIASGPPDALTHYEVLALDRGASDEEIRRAYRRMREIHSAESLATSGLIAEPVIANALARIEEARDVLLDPARRRPYDLSTTTAEALSDSIVPPSIPPPPQTEPLEIYLPELTPESEFSGALLRRVREARGAELKDVAARTKISIASLHAIETEDYTALPATVYLRGFVAEMAKYLRLDVEQVTRTYLRRYRRASQPGSAKTRT